MTSKEKLLKIYKFIDFTQNAAKNQRRFKPLSGLSLPELEQFVQSTGLPAFRGRQIHTWIYDKYASNLGPNDRSSSISQRKSG